MLDLSIEGLAEPIGVTANHPIWSEDRQEFVQAGSLQIGETLRQADGSFTQVASLLPRDSQEPVYNLEVEGEHVYYVSSSGLLVHNTKGYGFGSTHFGQEIHQTFGDHLKSLTTQKFRTFTGPGQTGVDATFNKAVHGMTDQTGKIVEAFVHAELKSKSIHGYEQFFAQMAKWNHKGLLKGKTALFMYDKNKIIELIGVFE